MVHVNLTFCFFFFIEIIIFSSPIGKHLQIAGQEITVQMFTVRLSSVVKQVHISAHEQSYFLPVGVLCDTTTVNKIQHFIYWKPRPCLIRKTVITP